MFSFSDKTRKIFKWSGVIAIILGVLAIYIGGGTEGMAIEIIGGVFAIIGIIMSFLDDEDLLEKVNSAKMANNVIWGILIFIGLIWLAVLILIGIFVPIVWLKVTIIVLLIIIPIVSFIIWVFKNYSGPQ